MWETINLIAVSIVLAAIATMGIITVVLIIMTQNNWRRIRKLKSNYPEYADLILTERDKKLLARMDNELATKFGIKVEIVDIDKKEKP